MMELPARRNSQVLKQDSFERKVVRPLPDREVSCRTSFVDLWNKKKQSSVHPYLAVGRATFFTRPLCDGESGRA